MYTVILEYIWLDGHGELRSKYKTAYVEDANDFELEQWNYDGSSTYQAETGNSEIILNPIRRYKNPFFEGSCLAYLVLCDTYHNLNGILVPTESNYRSAANEVFDKTIHYMPWFGIEQEYFMMAHQGTSTSSTPLFFKRHTHVEPQGNYYCGVGNQHIVYRQLAEKHYLHCLYAGLKISGINAEVAPNQWEYQIGPVMGIEAADQLWVSRYILHKLSEECNINISFKPKPVKSPWNGSGLHTNFSTIETRELGGLEKIHEYIRKLEGAHREHIEVYGDNSERLSGECETSDINRFSCGYGNRGCSIRIPTAALQAKQGYFEDRRPASDADPYRVTGALMETCCL
jgi:glutamine synthetase